MHLIVCTLFVDERIELEIDEKELVAGPVEVAAECLLRDFVVRLVGFGDVDDGDADLALRSIVACSCREQEIVEEGVLKVLKRLQRLVLRQILVKDISSTISTKLLFFSKRDKFTT